MFANLLQKLREAWRGPGRPGRWLWLVPVAVVAFGIWAVLNISKNNSLGVTLLAQAVESRLDKTPAALETALAPAPTPVSTATTAPEPTLVPLPTIGSPASNKGDVRGIYTVIRWNETPALKVWQDPCVDGVVLRTYWKDVEPAPGQYDWEYLDQQFAVAERYGKKLHVIIAPGFWSPDWVLQQVPTGDFEVRSGPEHGHSGPLPLPWSDTYLNLWLDFVKVFGERYRNAPLTLVSATGPTSQNGEMRLPIQREDEKKWAELGYTKDRLEEAWFRTLDGFNSALPGVHFTVALFQAPEIPDPTASTQVLEDVAAYGAKNYPDAFGIQSNGLDARKLEPHFNWELVESYSGIVRTGFMMSTSATQHPEEMGDADPLKALGKAIDRGLAKGVSFLEIYESDVRNPDMHQLICNAHEQLVP